MEIVNFQFPVIAVHCFTKFILVQIRFIFAIIHHVIFLVGTFRFPDDGYFTAVIPWQIACTGDKLDNAFSHWCEFIVV
jgi:hypothetical protein